eukprot:s458_g4.t1
MSMEIWKIVGGGDSGGILVRSGRDLKSPALAERLAKDSEIRQLELLGDRLRYQLQISVRISGKDLAIRLNGLGPGSTPTWIEESRAKMLAFREQRPMLPAETAVLPGRLQGMNPRDKLPPFKRLSHKEMQEMSLKNLPGHFSGMKFPHNAEQLKSFGPSWYTDAFHKFGTLPKDNHVTKVRNVQQLPHSGFDAAGGAGHKAFIELEYAKPDPNLHSQLFAKYPWDYFESETGKAYRMQISTYGDMDAAELCASDAIWSGAQVTQFLGLVLVDGSRLTGAKVTKISAARDNAFRLDCAAHDEHEKDWILARIVKGLTKRDLQSTCRDINICFSAESPDEYTKWTGLLMHTANMDGAIQTMRLGRDVAADIKEFRLSVKNRRMKVGADKKHQFAPIFRAKLWKVKAEGDRRKAEDWFEREMWVAKNGSLVYWSKKEDRELVYYTHEDIHKATFTLIANEDSYIPWAFQVNLPPSGEVQFAPGEFAAETEAMRDCWIEEFRKIQG